MMPSDEEILAEIDEAVVRHNIPIDKARALLALKSVYRIESQVRAIFEEIKTRNERLEKLIIGYKRSQHSGEAQASAEFDKVLRDLGIKGGK